MTEEEVTKPPLGLEPMWLWNETRMWDIIAAIQRYREAGKEIPGEWIIELWQVIPFTKCFEAQGIGRYYKAHLEDKS